MELEMKKGLLPYAVVGKSECADIKTPGTCVIDLKQIGGSGGKSDIRRGKSALISPCFPGKATWGIRIGWFENGWFECKFYGFGGPACPY